MTKKNGLAVMEGNDRVADVLRLTDATEAMNEILLPTLDIKAGGRVSVRLRDRRGDLRETDLAAAIFSGARST